MTDYMTYEKFGVNFIHHAVTAERIAASLQDVAGDEIKVGPLQAGPGGVATVNAVGHIQDIVVTHEPGGDHLQFVAVLPIDLDLEVKLGPVPNRYNGTVEVPLALTVRAAEPLTLVIDIEPIIPKDVKVSLEAQNVGADLLQRVGNLDAEVQMQVARDVNKQINSERSMKTRIIDVAKLVEDSWED